MVEPGDIPLIVRPDNEPSYRVVADMRDLRFWERIGPRNTLRKFAENPSSDDYYSLAHAAIRRQCLRTVPGYSEFIDTHVVVPDQRAAAKARLDRDELVAVIDKAMSYEEATADSVADTVMDLLDVLWERSTDPTRPAL